MSTITCKHCGTTYPRDELAESELNWMEMGKSCLKSTCPGLANEITKEQFMAYYRSERYSEELSVDDRIEVFLMALTGSADITAERLIDLCSEYDVDFDKLVDEYKAAKEQK